MPAHFVVLRGLTIHAGARTEKLISVNVTNVSSLEACGCRGSIITMLLGGEIHIAESIENVIYLLQR